MKKLSIVVLNYNTKDLLRNCFQSIEAVSNEVDLEVVVVDNGSTDGSITGIKGITSTKEIRLIENKKNLGFAKGNNRARKFVSGEYVLFLNSDTELERGTLAETIKYLDANESASALTCKILLPDGSLDKDARRSFPTPWVAFTHFLGFDRIFPRSSLFARYWYGDKSGDQIHEIDSLQGAFCLVRKKILDDVGWFDEDYFLDGEDIDLCWKIKEKGGKIVYFPKASITHAKGASKDKGGSFGRVTKEERIRFINAGTDSMEIFYKKRLSKRYPFLITSLVFFGIATLKRLRYLKALIQ